MNIQNEKKSEQLYEVRIEIEAADYAEKVEKQLKKRRREEAVPGFRPGNAPMAMIKRMYERDIIAMELLYAVDPALDAYVKEQNWKVLGFPVENAEKTIVDYSGKTNSIFVFDIALQPEFEINYDQLPAVKRIKIAASENEIQEKIQQLRKRHGRFEKTTELVDEDLLRIKTNDQHEFICMTYDFTEEGRKLLIGKKLHDKVDVDLKAIFSNENIWAKALGVTPSELKDDLNYNVTLEITDIDHNTPAELNEEFFKAAFPKGDVTNENELTAFATNEVEKMWVNESNRYFSNEAIETLLKNVNITLPEDEFLKKLIARNNSSLSDEQIEEGFSNMKDGIKWEIISAKIIEAEALTVAPDEIRAYIRNYFISSYFASIDESMISDQLEKMVDKQMQDKQVVRTIYDEVLSEKVTGVLAQKMKLDEKTCTFQEFLNEVTGKAVAEPKKKAAKAKKETAASAEEKEGEIAEKPAKKACKKAAKTDETQAE